MGATWNLTVRALLSDLYHGMLQGAGTSEDSLLSAPSQPWI